MKNFFHPYIKMDPIKARMIGLVTILIILAAWSAIAVSGIVSSNKLPAPWDIAKALGYLAYSDGKSMLLDATLSSLARVFSAGFLVIAVGVPVGIMMGASPMINAALSPILDPFRSAPIVAFLPLFVMWLGINETMKVAFLFCGSVIYLIPMTRDAIQAVPASYMNVARDIGATNWESVTKTVVPLAMPRIADAIIVSFSIIWTYITVAEYVNAQSGLGQLIQNARRFSAMDQVCAGILVIVLLAMATHYVMTLIRERMFSWEIQK